MLGLLEINSFNIIFCLISLYKVFFCKDLRYQVVFKAILCATLCESKE